MKSIRLLHFFPLLLLLGACSEDDTETIPTPEASFSITASPDNPNFYYLDNTTPNAEDHYSFWDISDGTRILDEPGLEVYEFKTPGQFSITLNIVGDTGVKSSSSMIMVGGAGPSFCEDETAKLLAGTCADGETGKTWVWSKLAGAYGVGPGTAGNDSTDPFDISFFSSPENTFVQEDGSTCVYDDKYVFKQDLNLTYENQNNDSYQWIWSWANEELGTNNGEFEDGCYASREPDSSSWTIETRTGSDGADYPWLILSNGASIAYYEGTSEYQIYSITEDKMVLRNVTADPGVPSTNWRYYTLVKEGTVEDITPPPPPPAGDLVNILLNGELELGDGDDFTNWSKLNGAERMTEETADVFEGSRAMKVMNEVDGNPWETQLSSDAVATEVDAQYTASVWIKGDDGTIRFSTNAQLGNEQYAGDFTVTAEWTQYTWTFTATTEQTTLVLDMGTTLANYVVDGIALVKGDTAFPAPEPEGNPDNLAVNGDFELGDGDDFTNWSKFNGPDNMTAETTDVHGGARALLVTNPADGNPWETQLSSDAIATEIGVEYTVSAWVKGDAAVIRYSTNAQLGDEQYAGDYNVTEDWSQYTWSFTASTAETTIVLDMGTTGGTFIVDDVEVVKN